MYDMDIIPLNGLLGYIWLHKYNYVAKFYISSNNENKNPVSITIPTKTLGNSRLSALLHPYLPKHHFSYANSYI